MRLGIIRSRKSKDITYDGIKKTAKMTSNNNQQQTTTQKIKDQATRTPLQTDSEPMSPRKVVTPAQHVSSVESLLLEIRREVMNEERAKLCFRQTDHICGHL
jgi:hypothetical protein